MTKVIPPKMHPVLEKKEWRCLGGTPCDFPCVGCPGVVKVCRQCSGAGYIPTRGEDYTDCPGCGGTGKMK